MMFIPYKIFGGIKQDYTYSLSTNSPTAVDSSAAFVK